MAKIRPLQQKHKKTMEAAQLHRNKLAKQMSLKLRTAGSADVVLLWDTQWAPLVHPVTTETRAVTMAMMEGEVAEEEADFKIIKVEEEIAAEDIEEDEAPTITIIVVVVMEMVQM
jgi:hypothetical protein